MVKNSHGLAIYYPADSGDYNIAYDSLVFAESYVWDEWIKGWGRILYPPDYTWGGSGFDKIVPLEWLPPSRSYFNDLQGKKVVEFVIYRTVSPDTNIDDFKEVGRVIVEKYLEEGVNEPFNFIDTTVENGKEYFYFVTANYEEGEGIPGNIVKVKPGPGFSSEVYFTNTPPTIDGKINEKEWKGRIVLMLHRPEPDSALEDATDSISLLHDSSFLYVAVQFIRSDTLDVYFSLYFDENHDHMWPKEKKDSLMEGGIMFYTYGDTVAGFTGYYGSYPCSVFTAEDTATLKGVEWKMIRINSSTVSIVNLEAKINLTESPLNAKVGQTIGLGFEVGYMVPVFMGIPVPVPTGETPYTYIEAGPRTY